MFRKLFHSFHQVFVPEKKNTFSMINVIRMTVGSILIITSSYNLLAKTYSLDFGDMSLPGILKTIIEAFSASASVLIIIIGLMIIPKKKSVLLGDIKTSGNKKSLFLKIYPFIMVAVSAIPLFWGTSSFQDIGTVGLAVFGFVLAYFSILFVILLLAIISSISKRKEIYMIINILLSIFSFILILIIIFPSIFLGLFK